MSIPTIGELPEDDASKIKFLIDYILDLRIYTEKLLREDKTKRPFLIHRKENVETYDFEKAKLIRRNRDLEYQYWSLRERYERESWWYRLKLKLKKVKKIGYYKQVFLAHVRSKLRKISRWVENRLKTIDKKRN